MKTNLIITIICFTAFLGFGFNKANNFDPRMPVFISYMKKQAPDSIQDFIKVYFQVKRIEVIDFNGYMSLFKEQLSGKMNEWVTSGQADGMSDSKLAKYKDEISRPLCNLLAMNLFSDSTRKDIFLIDSISWFVDVMPVKDTSNRKKNTYIPQSELKNNPYTILKSFTDVVLQSKLLK